MHRPPPGSFPVLLGFGLLSLWLGPLTPGLDAARSADPPAPPATAIAKQYQALLKDYEKAEREFLLTLGKVKDDEERRKVLAQSPAIEYSRRFLELAQQDAQDPGALEALGWVVDRNQHGPAFRQALALLEQHHVRDERIGPICAGLAYAWEIGANELLRAVVEKNPSKQVQGTACLTLARHLKNEAGLMRRLKQSAEMAKRLSYLSPAYLKVLQDGDADRSAREAEEACERVLARYADLKRPNGKQSLGDQARALLFEMRHLAIGKAAPDIEGDDIDGARFKLSDYRGKVVLLDFWGHW